MAYSELPLQNDATVAHGKATVFVVFRPQKSDGSTSRLGKVRLLQGALETVENLTCQIHRDRLTLWRVAIDCSGRGAVMAESNLRKHATPMGKTL